MRALSMEESRVLKYEDMVSGAFEGAQNVVRKEDDMKGDKRQAQMSQIHR
jgi:hypothetical protein